MFVVSGCDELCLFKVDCVGKVGVVVVCDEEFVVKECVFKEMELCVV